MIEGAVHLPPELVLPLGDCGVFQEGEIKVPNSLEPFGQGRRSAGWSDDVIRVPVAVSERSSIWDMNARSKASARATGKNGTFSGPEPPAAGHNHCGSRESAARYREAP